MNIILYTKDTIYVCIYIYGKYYITHVIILNYKVMEVY